MDLHVLDLVPVPIVRTGEGGWVPADHGKVFIHRALDIRGLDVVGIERPPVRPGADLAEVRVGRDLKGISRGPSHQGEGEEEGERQLAQEGWDHNGSSINPN